jgi:ketosteroid isomerase-like protein
MAQQHSAPAPNAPHFELVLSMAKNGGLNDEARRNREKVVNAYQAMFQGNENALTEIMHPDVVFREAKSLPYGVEVKGLNAALQGIAGMFASWSRVRAEIFECLAGGDLVIAYMMLKNVARATGETYEGPVAEVFRFRNGKVVEWFPIYWDTHRVRQVCGLA